MPAELMKNADLPAARALWKHAFRDTDGYIDAFFRLCFSEGRALIIKDGGIAASMGFLLDAGEVCGLSGEKNARVSMIYAVATDSARQGRGYAAEIIRGLVSRSKSLGFWDCILRPANAGLFGYYARFGFKPSFYGGFEPPKMPPLRGVSAEEYARARREFSEAAGAPYLEYSAAVYGLISQYGSFFTAHSLCAVSDGERYFGLAGGRYVRDSAPRGMSVRGEEYYADLWLD